MGLWDEEACAPWHQALELYAERLVANGSDRLVELDTWYRTELPPTLAARQPAYIEHDELVRLVTWKMMRGAWRARNRQLVAANDAGLVEYTSQQAFELLPDLRKAISKLSELGGLGPATASAVLAAFAPDQAPFLDEAMALQVPGLQPVAYTLSYYLRYAEQLQSRAAQLTQGCPHEEWTPHMVDLALWSESAQHPKKI